jgi:hypothetical protein
MRDMKAASEKKTVGVKVSLTPAEFNELKEVCDSEHLAPSTLARLFVLRNLRACRQAAPILRNSALRTPHSALISGVAS